MSATGASGSGAGGRDARGPRAVHPCGAMLVSLAALGFLACLRLGAPEGAVAAPSVGARLDPPRHRIDVSTASVAELALLPEIGPSLAARIVADRAALGPFGSVDDLARVEGLGVARIEALREDARAGFQADLDLRRGR